MRPQQVIVIYLVCGMVSGLMACPIGVVAFAAFEAIMWRHLDDYKILVPCGWDPHFSAGLLKELGQILLRGLPISALAGFLLALPVRIAVHTWRNRKGTLLAVLLSASLTANCLILDVLTAHFPIIETEFLRVLLLIGMAAIVGAIYGFLLMYLASRLEKRLANRQAEPNPVQHDSTA